MCRVFKTFEEFSRRSSSKDGRNYVCKACDSLIQKRERAGRSAETKLRYAKTADRWLRENQDKRKATAARYRLAHASELKEAQAQRYKRDPFNVLAINKRWRDKNPEKMRAAVRGWVQLNPARYRANQENWARENPEKIRAYGRRWARDNPDKRSAKAARRGAGKLKATPAWADKFFIDEIYHLASLRTKLTGIKWHVDHAVPLRSKHVCGLHNEFNLQVIPAKLNIQKGNRTWPNMGFSAGGNIPLASPATQAST